MSCRRHKSLSVLLSVLSLSVMGCHKGKRQVEEVFFVGIEQMRSDLLTKVDCCFMRKMPLGCDESGCPHFLEILLSLLSISHILSMVICCKWIFNCRLW